MTTVRRLAGIVLILASVHLTAPLRAQSAPWLGQEDEIERFLATAAPISRERLGSGITRPYKVLLELEGRRRQAVFKPIVRSAFEGGAESYRSEIAAYRLSRHLGIDMVPPTVERRLGRRYGSLQLWVDGFRPFVKAIDEPPASFGDWSRQMARMSLFDLLIDNPDRHAANFLVDPAWNVVLIDHSRALNSNHRGPLRTEPPPLRFERELIERIAALDFIGLRELLGDQLSGSDLRTLLLRRNELLAHVARIADRRGPQIAFYRD
ncbi:MAG TPA: hypothetical protein VMT85_18920 [Thermoanaerobaculia bacterium]|nr:hypothetical protein [Thermoanaerobaculia bacterium]